MEYKLSNARVSGVHASKSVQVQLGLPTEEVTLAFAKIKWTYCGTDLGTGKSMGSLMYEHTGAPTPDTVRGAGNACLESVQQLNGPSAKLRTD